MTPPKLTAVVIAKDEEEMLPDCLDSLSFADSLVVVDNNSTDATKAIAKEHNAVIVSADTTDFSKLRELGLKAVKEEYILYVDADERVPRQLQDEIKKVIMTDTTTSVFRLPRQNYYLGKNAWPQVEYLERLFKRSSLKGWRGEVHESAEYTGSVTTLQSPLIHYTHRDFSSMVDKTNHWSETEAMLRFDAHHPKVTWWRFPRVMTSAFVNSYITKRGWRAGTVGLLESIYQSFSMFITYAKLWEMQEKKTK